MSRHLLIDAAVASSSREQLHSSGGARCALTAPSSAEAGSGGTLAGTTRGIVNGPSSSGQNQWEFDHAGSMPASCLSRPEFHRHADGCRGAEAQSAATVSCSRSRNSAKPPENANLVPPERADPFDKSASTAVRDNSRRLRPSAMTADRGETTCYGAIVTVTRSLTIGPPNSRTSTNGNDAVFVNEIVAVPPVAGATAR